jgi:hypothetical protein
MTWLVRFCNRYPSWVFMQYMCCWCHHLLHLFQIIEVLIIYDCQLYNIFVFVNKLLVSVNSVFYNLHCGSKQTLHYAVSFLILQLWRWRQCVSLKHLLTFIHYIPEDRILHETLLDLRISQWWLPRLWSFRM